MAMLRQFPAKKKGFESGDEVIKLKGCPDCKGRGYFLIQPFLTGGSNLCGGISNTTQCPTCKSAHDYYEKHGKLPDDIAAAMENKAAVAA